MTEPRSAERAGHEQRDIDPRRIAALGLGLAAALVLVLLLMVWLFDSLAARETRRQSAPINLAEKPGHQLPPEPRLQSLPAKDLQEMLADEEARMTSYGWTDRAAGKVRIPIERAMELTAQRGLPVRDGARP